MRALVGNACFLNQARFRLQRNVSIALQRVVLLQFEFMFSSSFWRRYFHIFSARVRSCIKDIQTRTVVMRSRAGCVVFGRFVGLCHVPSDIRMHSCARHLPKYITQTQRPEKSPRFVRVGTILSSRSKRCKMSNFV